MKQFIFFLLSVALLVGCNAAPQSGKLSKVSPESVGMSSQKLYQMDEVIEGAVARSEIPGAVVAVVRGDKLAWLKAYGYKQVIPDTIKMTENTIFDMASVSKCVGTTLSFMQLIENGKVRLTDPVEMYLPWFQRWTDPQTGRQVSIEIQDLLSHSSGIPAYISVPPYIERYGENTPDSLIRYIGRELPLKYRPKTGYTYSCLNFITLQNILQVVTGKSLSDYARENVYMPLGLKHTAYLPLEKQARERSLSAVAPDFLSFVAPTTVQEDGKPLIGEVHDPIARRINNGNSGNAGVFSNAEDLAVIAAAIMNYGEINGVRILSPLTVKTMLTNPKENDPSIERCLGWDTYTSGAGTKGDLFLTQRGSFVHTGYTGTSMLIDMESQTAVIILTNRAHPHDGGAVARTRALVANIVAGAVTD